MRDCHFVLLSGHALRSSDTAQAWTLLDEASAPEERKVRGTLALARLKQNATREQALGELNTIARELERTYPETNRDWRFAGYVPYAQAPAGSMILFVRASSGDSGSLLPAVRESIRAVDANLPLDQVQTLASALEETIAPQRTSSMMITVFGVAATILAMAGIYGFLTYHVTRRSREIGIRMALGANVPAVVRLVMGQTTRLIALGLGIGLAGAALLTRLLSGFLFEVSSLDAVTYFTVGALFIGIGSLAALVPTLRAAAIHPTLALRTE